MKDFRLDASSDALVLENDTDLRYFRGVSKRYSGAGADFVFMAYSPPEDLFSQPSLDRIKRLREELKGLPRVKSVVTILDVPLLMNPPSSLGDLKENLKTLEDPKADLPLAVAEFGDSPIYQNLMVSQDLKSCAIQVNFRTEESDALLNRREELRQKKRDGALSSGELGELEQVEAEYRHEKDRVRSERHEDLIAIRKIVRKYQNESAIVLGGVPMIVDDMISFIKSDMKVFGAGMTLLLVGLLYLEFRRIRWVILPLLTCLASVFTMMGLLGLFKFDVTVISSNFTSLQLILTLQLAVHLVGHYRELLSLHPEKPNFELVRESVHRVFVPAFYCQLTTIVGFASLIACDILPVVNFGWMMS
jgi:predicted RND superfamily exporter protein